jgi:hypothetical protein
MGTIAGPRSAHEDEPMKAALRAVPTQAPLPPTELADASASEAAELRYLEALEKLVGDALEHGRVAVLADTLAWTIARIIVGCGLGAAGDIFRRIGGYIGTCEEQRCAEAEAEAARKEGRPTH